MVLYPSLIVSDRKKKGANDLWPAEAQLWVLNKVSFSTRIFYQFTVSKPTFISVLITASYCMLNFLFVLGSQPFVLLVALYTTTFSSVFYLLEFKNCMIDFADSSDSLILGEHCRAATSLVEECPIWSWPYWTPE